MNSKKLSKVDVSKGFIFSITTALSWAVMIIITRTVLASGANVYSLAFWTSLFALPYWFFIGWKRRHLAIKLKRSDIGILVAMGIISTFGVGITEVFALKYTPAATYAFLIRFIVIFTIIFAAIWLRETITKKKIILVSLIMTGAFILTGNGALPVLTIGVFFTLLEAALIAFGNNILGKISTNRMDANLAATGMFLIGLLPTGLLAIFNNATALPSAPIILVASITCLSLLLTTTRFQAYRHASASCVTIIMSFTPVFVSIMAFIFLGETLTQVQLFGGGLIVLSGILVEKLKI